MSHKWIRKGDKVVVATGNDRGRVGTVLKRQGDKVVIQGINIRKKHVKRRSQAQMPTIIELEMPLHISNIFLCDDDDKKICVKARQFKKEKRLIYFKGEKEVVLRSLKNLKG